MRPAEAAGLVLIRQSDRAQEVLLGRRHRDSRFMPGVYVFPGGRLSRADRQPSGFPEALSATPGLDRATSGRLAVFARAALRETFEETGLLLGNQDPGRNSARGRAADRAAVWAAYDEAGFRPAFDGMRLVARAITPKISPIRFHSRFFLADGGAARGELAGDGELVDLGWVPVEVAPTLPMAEVTVLVLQEALAHRRVGASAGRPAALFTWIGPKEQPRFRQAPAGQRA